MQVVFYAPDGTGDKLLVAAVMGGAEAHGDEVQYVCAENYRGVVVAADAAACYGVRASTRIILDAYRRAGKKTLYFDKGFVRGNYTRVAVDAWQPQVELQPDRSDDRLQASGLQLKPMRRVEEGSVIYAATTQTWVDFYNLGPARGLDEIIVRLLCAQYPGRVVYRPRPAYAKKHPELCGPIDGARLSDPTIPLVSELEGCDLLVTLGSNAAVEARAAGVKTLVLSDNPMKWLNGSHDEALRDKLFRKLAYCQWTLSEYLSGEAWSELKPLLEKFADLEKKQLCV